MAGFRIEGNTSGNVAEVDSNNNFKVALPLIKEQAGYAKLAGRISEAGDPAGLVVADARVSISSNLAVGQPVPLLNEVFNSTALNTAIFSQASTTQTITVGGGTLNLNASAIPTLSTYCRVSTYQYFPINNNHPLVGSITLSFSVDNQINNQLEIGFIVAATNAAPIDGAFFRYDTAGVLKCVLNNNGVEYTSAALTNPTTAIAHIYAIVVSNEVAIFYINGVCQAIIPRPTGLGNPTYAQSLPFMVRNINAAVAPALASVVRVGSIYVGLSDAAGMGKSQQELAAFAGKMGSQGQQGHTMGSTALYTNSLAPPAGAAMTNTTAALGVGLGGQFTALPTLAANTDGIVCSYQNPVPTAAIPGKTLYISGIRIQSIVTVLLAGGPVNYVYSLAHGATNVSLATTEAAGAKAPRRIPLCIETFAANAALGTLGSQGHYIPFDAPIAVFPGEFVQLVAKNIGTVTTTGAITFLVSFNSYWE